MILEKVSKAINLIKKVAESFYLSIFTLLFGVLFWALNLTNVVVFGLLGVFVFVLIFAKDLKNLFTPVFYISLFIPEIHVMNDYTAYYIAVGVALLTLVVSIVYRTIKKKNDIKIGKFTIGIIASYVAYLLGGLFYKFTLEVTLMIFGFGVATYTLYFIAINFTDNLREFFENLFIIGGLIVGAQIAQTNVGEEAVTFFSAQGVNTAVLFVILGLVACFTKGLGKKHDYLYFILAVVLSLLAISSRCRMGMLVVLLVDVSMSVLLALKTKNERILLSTMFIILLVAVGLTLLSPWFKQLLAKIVFVKDGLSGRETLWTLSLDLFKKAPIFGAGFRLDEPYTFNNGDVTVLLAHNTFLQWLACVGIVGTLIMAVFYINKYYIVFRSFNLKKLFAMVSILSLAITGLMDQAANMDFFVVLISILLVASVEKEETLPLKK